MTELHRAARRCVNAALALALLVPLAACGNHSDAGIGLLPAAPSGGRFTSAVSTASVPAHVQTATYLWSATEIATDPSTYAPYLTWAYPTFSNMAETKAAGIKVIFYSNPVMPQAPDVSYTALQTTYSSVAAKDCTGRTIAAYNGKGLVADPRTSQAAAYVTAQINNIIQTKVLPSNPGSTHPWDAVFVDNDGALYGVTPLPCNYDSVSWGAAMDAAVSAAGQPVIVNSLSTSLANVQTYANYVNGTNVIGGEWEECFMNNTWAGEEQSQIDVIANLKRAGKAPGAGFWCYLDNTNADGATAIPQRLFSYASFLLTYDPNYSVFQESFTTPSTFQVFPETGFVPLQPASAPSSYTSLQIAGGAYVQTYGACYYRGAALGPCEVAVNPGSSTVPLPNSYTHSMVISGDGVLDGGSVTFTGAPVTQLAPKSGAILVAPATPQPAPTPAATTTPASTPAPTAAPAAAALSGTVSYATYFASSGQFQVKTASGYTWVCTNSGTTWSGASLAVGDAVAVSAGASTSSCAVAASILLAAPGSPMISGTVTYSKYYSTSGGFQITTPSGTQLWVYDSAPYNRPIAAGATVTAIGSYNSAGNLLASGLIVQ